MLLLSALEIVLQNGCSADRCCVRTVKKSADARAQSAHSTHSIAVTPMNSLLIDTLFTNSRMLHVATGHRASYMTSLFGFVKKHACDRRTDRQTDRQTNRITTHKTALAYSVWAVKN